LEKPAVVLSVTAVERSNIIADGRARQAERERTMTEEAGFTVAGPAAFDRS